MQVLWSRAAQNRASCRCSSCLHAATGVARQTTTAGSKRGLKAGDLFTACYSTILASAALADSKVKDGRRKEWDRVIAEAKAGKPIEVPEDTGRAESKSRSLNTTINSYENSTFEDGGRPIRTNQSTSVLNGKSWTVSLEETPLQSKLRILDAKLKQSLGSTTVASTGNGLAASTQSTLCLEDEWIDGVPDTQLPLREPETKVHLNKMENMVVKLIDQLLFKTRVFSDLYGTGPSTRSALSVQMRDIAQQIEEVQRDFTQLPAYTWESKASVEQKRFALHKSLNAVCKKTMPGQSNVDLMLAKICYNLLVSTAPPSITTYNLMIKELSRLEQHDITQIVVDSFLYDSKFTPTSTTVGLILDHYTAKRDPRGFQTIINRMRGTDGDMRIKKRVIYQLRNPKVQEWALANKVIHRGNYLTAKTHRDANVFDSLIQGCLHLKGVKPAICYVRTALREGQQVQEKTLCIVIKSCLAQLDFRAGDSLLKAILSLWKDGEFPTIIRFSGEVRYCIHQLLGLCGIDSSSNSKQVLPNYLSQEGLRNMLRHMQLESITDAVDQFAARVWSLESALGLDSTNSHPSVSSQNSKGVQNALQILRRHSKTDKRRKANRETSTIKARWTKIRALESKITTEAEQITAKEIQLLPIVYRELSNEYQEKYNLRLRRSEQTYDHMTISSRLDLLLHFSREQRQKCSENVFDPGPLVLQKGENRGVVHANLDEPEEGIQTVALPPYSGHKAVNSKLFQDLSLLSIQACPRSTASYVSLPYLYRRDELNSAAG